MTAPTYAVTLGTIIKVEGDATSTVTIATSPAVAGATVRLTVVIKDGMQLKAETLKANYNDGTAKVATLTGTGTSYTFTMPAYAVSVTAEFEEIPAYAVTFTVTNGTDRIVGAHLTINETKLTDGSGVATFSNLADGTYAYGVTAEGFDAITGGSVTVAGVDVDVSVTMTATAAPTTYTVTYDLNGGTTGTQTDAFSPYLAGATVTVLGQGSMLYTGYTFSGWNTVAVGGGDAYAADATFAIRADWILYAQWLSSDATLTSTIGKVDDDAGTIVDIPNGTTLAAFKAVYGPAVTEKTAYVDYVYTLGSTSPNPVTSLGDNAGAGYAYVYCGLGRVPADGVGYPDDFAGLDLTGKIALIDRGTTNFYMKINNAAARGAVGVVIANNVAGSVSMDTTGATLTSMSVSQADGASLKLQAAAPDGDGTGCLIFLVGCFAGTITPATGATFEVYDADGATVAEDLASGYKVIVTAEDLVTTKTYTVSVLPASSDATLTSTIGKVDDTAGTIVDIPNGTTLAAFKAEYGPAVTETTAAADYVYIVGSASPNPVTSLGDNEGAGYAYVYCGLGDADDFAGLDLTGKIALIDRGGTTWFYRRINNAAACGAVGVIMANNVAGMVSVGSTGATLTSMSVSQADGASLKLKAAVSGDGTGRLKFLGNFAGTITPAAGATFEVYNADGSTVATDLVSGDLVIVTAEDLTTKTYTVTVLPAATTDIAAAGVTGFVAPVTGAVPQVFGALAAGAATYTVTGLTWAAPDNSYLAATAYTATVELTSAAGYKFPVAGIVAPIADVGTVSSVGTTAGGDVSGNTLTFDVLFPATAPIAITAIGAITGTPEVGQVLTAGALTPSAATVTYLWTICDTVDGTYTDIGWAATSITYTPVAWEVGRFIEVVATGTGSYSGTVTSDPTTAVVAAPAVGTAAANETESTIAYTLTTGTFDAVTGIDTDNWTLAGDDVADLGNITDVALSVGNTVATITIDGTVGAPGQDYTVEPAQAAFAAGFTAPAAATVTITAEPPTVTDAVAALHGMRILVTFSKAMSDPSATPTDFIVTLDGVVDDVTTASLYPGDSTIIVLVLTTPVLHGQVVTLGYAGTLTAEDGGVLAAFADRPVTNNSIRTLTPAPALANGLIFADDPANDTNTLITLGLPSVSGNIFAYTISEDAFAVPTPNVGDDLNAWTAVTTGASIAVLDGTHIGVAEVDATLSAVQFSDAIAVTEVEPVFVATTDSSTANTVPVLGIVGTGAVSDTPGVATTDLTTAPGFVTITSVGAGAATITVDDGSGHTATIAVTVAADGSITIGAITKYASTLAEILTYSFPEQTGPAVIDSVAGTIDIEVANGTDPSDLVATFTTSDAIESIQIGVDDQESGVTSNDFTGDVTYTVTAEDGITTKDWVVYVTEAEPVEITGFTALTPVDLTVDEHLVDLAALTASGKLPTTVTVTDGTTPVDATITGWTGTFDGTTTGDYILTAVWTMPTGYVDAVDPIAVPITVTVTEVQTAG
ncbi:PA domain-containing protein [Candidatus Cryosericum odellii]|nr:PA domain-containing protein [Candidatus Cryosericum odellii]